MMWLKKIYLIVLPVFILGCSSVLPTTKDTYKNITVTTDYMIQKSISEIQKVYNIDITEKDTAIVSSGKGEWKVYLYGMTHVFVVQLDKDGEIIKVEKKDYI